MKGPKIPSGASKKNCWERRTFYPSWMSLPRRGGGSKRSCRMGLEYRESTNDAALQRNRSQDRRVGDASKTEHQDLCGSWSCSEVIGIELKFHDGRIFYLIRHGIQIFKAHLPRSELPFARFPAEGSEGVVARIGFNCFDGGFDFAFGTFKNLEEILIAIEEKAGDASAGIVAAGDPE